MQVITYMSPGGDTFDVTPEQEKRLNAAGVWPKDWRGQEYCRVSHGLHGGDPTYSDRQIDRMVGAAAE